MSGGLQEDNSGEHMMHTEPASKGKGTARIQGVSMNEDDDCVWVKDNQHEIMVKGPAESKFLSFALSTPG